MILCHERVPLDVKLERVDAFMEGEFYRDNYFRVGGLVSAIKRHYPTDRNVIRLVTLHLCHGGMFEEAAEYLRSHTYDANAKIGRAHV